jgi:crotonobetainyl-CoA:carnitine CoA-transferase CaiB-like acyl-CoA transferase
MLQPGRYWADFCRHIERDDLITDPRFATVEALMTNAREAAEIVKTEIATRTFAEWIERFQTLDGQWAPVQNSLELGNDPQLRANGFVASVLDADGVERELVTNPVQFDETAPTLRRAPQFSEHGEEILRELGRTDDEIIQLKLDDVVT